MSRKLMKAKSSELYDAALQAEDDGRANEAIQLYQEAINADKNSPLPRFKLAALLLEHNKYQEAINVSRLFVKRWPWWSAYLILGNSYQYLGQYSRAIRALNKSIEIKPKPETWFFLAYSLTSLGRDKKAIACYQKAIELDPDYDEAHYNLGCCYKLQNQTGLAEIHLRRAIEIDPQYSLAYAELGIVMKKKGELKEAIKCLRKSIRLDPEYGWSRVYFANTLWTQRKLKAADEQYRKVIEIWPKFSLSYWCYGGFLAFENRNVDLAEQYLRKAVELEPDDEESNYWLGKCLLEWNRQDEAKIYLKKAAQSGHLKATKLLANTWPSRPRTHEK